MAEKKMTLTQIRAANWNFASSRAEENENHEAYIWCQSIDNLFERFLELEKRIEKMDESSPK